MQHLPPDPQVLHFVRETADSPLYLAFKGLNNYLSEPYNSLPKAHIVSTAAADGHRGPASLQKP
jgi:hypothetical protein